MGKWKSIAAELAAALDAAEAKARYQAAYARQTSVELSLAEHEIAELRKQSVELNIADKEIAALKKQLAEAERAIADYRRARADFDSSLAKGSAS